MNQQEIEARLISNSLAAWESHSKEVKTFPGEMRETYAAVGALLRWIQSQGMSPAQVCEVSTIVNSLLAQQACQSFPAYERIWKAVIKAQDSAFEVLGKARWGEQDND